MTDELDRFFARYLKGVDNGFERDMPPVRLSLLSFTGNDVVERPESQWPPAQVKLVPYYLDASTRSLRSSPVAAVAETSYEAHHMTDCADFRLTFDRKVELVGYPMVKLQSVDHAAIALTWQRLLQRARRPRPLHSDPQDVQGRPAPRASQLPDADQGHVRVP